MNWKMRSMSRNMCASLICKVVVLLSGLIVQRYMLIAFGSTYNGLTSLIGQVMTYLVLLEAGLGAASVQALYKPLNDADWNGVSGIMNATSRSYFKVGLMFGGLLLGGSFLIPLAVGGEVDYFLAGVLTLVTGAGNIVTYMLGAKNTALLTADRKMYVVYGIEGISTLLSAIFRVWALNLGWGIVYVQAIHFAVILLKNVVLLLYVKRKYAFLDRNISPNFNAISKRWNVLVHSIAGLIVNHTDILILTFAASLKLVSVYNVYNLIFVNLGVVIQTTFSQAPQGEFGKLLLNDKKQFERVYASYETLFSIVLFVVVTVALILTRPFVAVYTRGISDVVYVDFWLPVLFAVILLMNHIRVPAIVVINAKGDFKETQKGAIIESVINIVVSLALFLFTDLGMYGLLLGTICSYLYRSIDVIWYVYKNIIARSIRKLFRLFAINFACMVVCWYLFCIKFVVDVGSYLQWFAVAIGQGTTVLLIFAVANMLFNWSDTKAVAEKYLKKVIRHHKNKDN